MEERDLLDNLPILRLLPGDARALVVGSFEPVSFSFGDTIVREGEVADAFYVLASGRARIVKNADTGEEIPMSSLRAGDSFGEMGLLDHSTRTATVRASSDVWAWRLDKSVFEALLVQTPEIRQYLELQIRHRQLSNFFRHFTPFTRLPPPALALLLGDLENVTCDRGDLVVRQGEAAGPMYFVEEGHLRVFTEDEQGRRTYVAYLRKGDFFGELSVFRGSPRTASVEAVSACRLLALHAETLRNLLDRFPDFRSQIEQRVAQYDYKEVARVPLDFAQEILPAETAAQEKVGPDQVEQGEEETRERAGEPGGPFASEGLFVKQQRRIRRFPVVRQIDEMDCGAAALAMVCRHFGRAVSLARIRHLVHTSLDGTSLRGLCAAATELGLAARSVKASPRNLSLMPLPAIVHWEGNHWVVLYDVTDTHCRVADPALGLRRFSRAEFEKRWSGYAALFDYTSEFEQAPVAASNLTWLRPFFRPFARILLQALGLSLVVAVLQMVLPVFTQIIVDRVLVERDVSLLNLLMLSMGAVIFFLVLSLGVQRYLLSFVAVRIDASTLDFLTRKLLGLPMAYFSARRTGDIQRRLEGVRQVREFLVQSGVAGVTAGTQLVASLVLMLLYSRTLTLVFLATAPLYALLMFFSSRWLRPIFDTVEDSFGKYNSYQIDAIKGIETVKAMAAEGSFRNLMLNQFLGVARRLFKADFTVMGYLGAVQAVTLLTTVLFLGIGARQVLAGALTIGGLVAFNSLVALANAPILTLLTIWDNWQHSAVLLNRLNDVFEQEPEQGVDHSRLLPVKTLEGRIVLRNVGFSYGGPESPEILKGINFEVAPGRFIAIVGRSGSGKTTLVKCLAGLLEPTEGSITYDSVDLKTLNYRDLRRQIGFVLQENFLFADTIARNIAFGEDEPDMDRVLWASRVANAHEFVERFPLGYDTKVGESGLALSGGQKQRIAIARSVYSKPPVLVFDEATSSLDTESERAVQENLGRLLEGRTAFVIAHRLSTVANADWILVLEKGHLVEQGTHDQLFERRGLYYYLSSQQLAVSD
ncbi:MAG TPA: peptidase domain-containing ABC transporter [Thermoanaerobaculia bacterium]|nr:peptidase domain-containing ABC transporter [Thermoanaerobaculia bacterium]